MKRCLECGLWLRDDQECPFCLPDNRDERICELLDERREQALLAARFEYERDEAQADFRVASRLAQYWLEKHDKCDERARKAERDAEAMLDLAVEFEAKWTDALGAVKLALACLVDAEGELQRHRVEQDAGITREDNWQRNVAQYQRERDQLETQTYRLGDELAEQRLETMRWQAQVEAANKALDAAYEESRRLRAALRRQEEECEGLRQGLENIEGMVPSFTKVAAVARDALAGT